jgi:hypothetical protein
MKSNETQVIVVDEDFKKVTPISSDIRHILEALKDSKTHEELLNKIRNRKPKK